MMIEKKFSLVVASIFSLVSSGALANEHSSFKDGELSLNKDRFYVGVEALYGSLTTFQNTSPYAEIVPAVGGGSSNAYSFLPAAPNSWGFRVLGGYHLDSHLPQDLELSYLYLNNNGNAFVNGGTIYNNINVIRKTKDFFNGAVTNQTYNQYQTLQLNFITHKELQSYAPISLGPIFGIRGTYIKNGLNAYFTGGPSLSPTYNISDAVNFSNEAYGIGPQVGENVIWSITPRFNVGGDIKAGLLFGNQRARYNLNSYSNNGTEITQAQFNQIQSSVWAALLFSGQVYAGFDFVDNSKNNVRIEGGVSGDQYISSNSQNSFNLNVNNSGRFRAWNNFTFRDVFIRLIYKA